MHKVGGSIPSPANTMAGPHEITLRRLKWVLITKVGLVLAANLIISIMGFLESAQAGMSTFCFAFGVGFPEGLATLGMLAFWEHTRQSSVGAVTGVLLRIFWLLLLAAECVFWLWLTVLFSFGGEKALPMQILMVLLLLLPCFMVWCMTLDASLRVPFRGPLVPTSPGDMPVENSATTLPDEGEMQSGAWDEAKSSK